MSSPADELLEAVRGWFTYPDGERRTSGYLNVCFQAYQDGTAMTDWHTDAMDQTIVSLGASRRFCLGDDEVVLHHGDVIHIPAETRHCVPSDPTVTEERISLVFRGALT